MQVQMKQADLYLCNQWRNADEMWYAVLCDIDIEWMMVVVVGAQCHRTSQNEQVDIESFVQRHQYKYPWLSHDKVQFLFSLQKW